MKHGHAWAIGLLALTLSACGGSHHHDGGTTAVTTTGPGLTSEYRIESVLTDTSLDPDYIYQDPLDLQVLDSVQFQLVNYPGGTLASRHVVSSPGTSDVSFTTNDTLGTAGLLTPGGAFTASSTDSGTAQYIISATYQGQSYSAYYKTSPRLNSARVRGQVLSATNDVGVYNAEVDFYGPRDATTGARQVLIATVRTGPDGTFRASVPIPAANVDTGVVPDVTFTVRQPLGEGSTFTYGQGSYTTGGTDRPSLSLTGTDVYLDSTISLSSGSSNQD